MNAPRRPPRPAPPLVRLSLGGALLTLAVRGDICFALFPPTLAALVIGATALGGLAHLAWRLRLGQPGPLAALRGIWATPLTFAAGTGLLAALVLRTPRWLGYTDAWPRWTGLPPEELIPLAAAGAGALTLTTLGLAGAGLRRYLGDFALRGEIAREPRALPLVLGLGVVLGGLVLRLQSATGGLMAHLRAFVVLRMGRPETSLQVLRRMRREDPGHLLADSVLYRMGRIHLDHLAQPEHAAGLFSRLVSEHPDSPWRDDARLRLAWAQRRAGDPRAYEASLLALRREEPDSPHRGRAGLELAEHLREEGRDEEARALLEALCREGGLIRDRQRYPFDLAWVSARAAEGLE